jgi:outer membrane protein assembly factor BamB
MVTPAPVPTPLAGASGWPLAIFSERGPNPVFGPDGTAYLLAGSRGSQGQYRQSLVALSATGFMKPGWPIDEPPGSDYGSLAVAPDGSVYIEECSGPAVGCLLHRLGANGQELPGWPVEVPPDFACVAGGYCFNHLDFGPNGTTYLWRDGGLQVIAIEASGEITPGWPLILDSESGTWSNVQVSSDGTVVTLRGASLSALAPDGSPRPGWPVSVPDIGGYLLGPQGTVVTWSLIDNVGELCEDYRRTVFTVLGSDGRTLPGWPRGSKGYASSPVVDADGTVYYVSALGNVYAHDRAGEIKAGWPVGVPGAIGGCGSASPYLGPDGIIYVLADHYQLGSEVSALSSDGRSRPGWPYRSTGRLSLPCLDTDCPGYHVPPAFGPDGTVYIAVFAYGAGSWAVVALDREGHVKPGWPHHIYIEEPRSDIRSLDMSPDGRLYVAAGSCASPRNAMLLALDPDGQIPD